MTNRAWEILIAAAVLATPFARAGAETRGAPAGVVVSVEGKPEYIAVGQTGKPLKLRQSVYEGDAIKTGPNDKAAVAFLGGAEVRITGGSQFKVNSGGNKPVELGTRWGKLWSRMVGAGGSFSVRTPAAVAAVRGTEADVEAFDQTTVKVYEGHVDLSNDKGSQSLQAGQMSAASAGGAPDAPRQMGEGDLETWQNGISVIDASKQLQKLQKEAEKYRDVEIKGSKNLKLKLKKP